MKALLLITTIFITIASYAQTSRFVTVTSTNSTWPGTIQVLEGETAEVISSCGYGNPTVLCQIQKNGATFIGFPGGYGNQVIPRGPVVAGPAIISTSGSYLPSLLTVKITPAAYDVNKTLIIPPSTNQFYVTLETSTNLVGWADATNGVYGSPDVARFFRIRMDKQNNQ